MKIRLLAITSLIFILPLCGNATAISNNNMSDTTQNPWPPFYIGASMGYGVVNHMLSNDGQSAIGRLTFGYQVYAYQFTNRESTLNLELGLQNGKMMRHAPAVADATEAVDLPIQTTLNPVLDLLASLHVQFTPGSAYFGLLKAGIAYRQLQFPDGAYVSAINQISPEIQAGVGYMLSKKSRIVIYYQGIYANGSVNYTMSPNTLVTVSNIPTQQAGFLGFELAL